MDATGSPGAAGVTRIEPPTANDNANANDDNSNDDSNDDDSNNDNGGDDD